MQPFTMKAPCRMDTPKRVWDTQQSKWIETKPRLIQNPPQEFTDEQTAYLEKYTGMLGEYIHGLQEMREGFEAREKAGPIEFIYNALRILRYQGFEKIEETPTVRHLMGYLWDLVHRCETREIGWAYFEDQVERWQLVMLNKIDDAKTVANV